MMTCLDLLGLVFMHRHVEEDICSRLLQRADRILLGIDKLTSVPAADWPSVKLPPTSSEDTRHVEVAICKMKKLIVQASTESSRLPGAASHKNPRTMVSKLRRKSGRARPKASRTRNGVFDSGVTSGSMLQSTGESPPPALEDALVA
jgi:hypothetical protein